jgi:GNAT superfamily N-acetyltransferase
MLNRDNLRMQKFEPATASEAELRAAHVFLVRTSAELWPLGPHETFEEFLNGLRTRPPSEEYHKWYVTPKDASEPVAGANLFIWYGEANQHIANFWVRVLPEYRRQGIATRLLQPVAETARANDRALLQAWTTSNAPDGSAFMERIGAKMGQEESVSKLELREMNRDLIHEWLDNAEALQSEFELGFWVGKYPQRELETMTKMREVIGNSMPRDETEQEDDVYTVERVREWQESIEQRGIELWTAYVRERSTRRIAGYTELAWKSEHPEDLEQWDTGVLHEYRNRGIGRWLKAALIDRVQHERPQVQQVRTGNSSTNASMLRINHEMGFKPYQTTFAWQISLDKMFTYLASAGEQA